MAQVVEQMQGSGFELWYHQKKNAFKIFVLSKNLEQLEK
jgi:hypothetical protein